MGVIWRQNACIASVSPRVQCWHHKTDKEPQNSCWETFHCPLTSPLYVIVLSSWEAGWGFLLPNFICTVTYNTGFDHVSCIQCFNSTPSTSVLVTPSVTQTPPTANPYLFSFVKFSSYCWAICHPLTMTIWYFQYPPWAVWGEKSKIQMGESRGQTARTICKMGDTVMIRQ